MAQQRALPQSKETLLQSYNKRLKDDIKSVMDHFTEIIKTTKVGQGRKRERGLGRGGDRRGQGLSSVSEECSRQEAPSAQGAGQQINQPSNGTSWQSSSGDSCWTARAPVPIEDETQVSRATQGEQDNYEMHVQLPTS
ncbi:Mediator of RNA polymerase II transcription subunit 22 [Plecturocebus cupreus]